MGTIHCHHSEIGSRLFVYKSDAATDAVFDFYTGTCFGIGVLGDPVYWIYDIIHVKTIVFFLSYYFMLYANSEIFLKFGESSLVWRIADRLYKCSMLSQLAACSTTVVLLWRGYFSYEVFQFFCQRSMILLELSLIFLPIVILVVFALFFCAERGIAWYTPIVLILFWLLVPAVLHIVTDGWYNIDFTYVCVANDWAPEALVWRIGLGPYRFLNVLDFAYNVAQYHVPGQELQHCLLNVIPFSHVIAYLDDLAIYESRIFGVFLVTLWIDPCI